ncbi:hypothetical protein ACEUZ9_004122 [Paracoccus litorisediminis]
MADFRHRALRHHAFGIFEAEREFGVTITNSAGRKIPVRFIGEQHVKEDCGGKIPSVQDWLRGIERKPWMQVGNLRDDTPERHGAADLSLESWQAEVAAGRTTLGHLEWAERLGMVLAGMNVE